VDRNLESSAGFISPLAEFIPPSAQAASLSR